MRQVSDLKKGDVIRVDGVRFVIDKIANLPNGKTTILFEDMPATDENMAAYGKLLKLMKKADQENDKEVAE